MECPKCHKAILKPVERCEACGYLFRNNTYKKLEILFALKKDVAELRLLTKNEIWNKLHALTEKIELYEKLLGDDLGGQGIAEPTGEIAETSQGQLPSAGDEIRPVPQQKPADQPKPSAAKPATSQKTVEDASGMEIRLGQKWLLIIGIVTTVFGVGYFLKYTFEMGWIGPAGRISMAYLWGITFLFAGNQYRKTFETFGLYLIGGGVATLYFSTFAAFQLYHLFGQIPSFSIMVIITVLACVLAVFYDTKWLAVLGLIGGFLTPLVLSTGQDNQIALMTYMTILNLGLLSIAFYKKWDLLNFLGFIITYLLYTSWFAVHYASSKFWPSIIFLNIFYLMYAVIPFAYQFFRITGEQMRGFLIMTPNSLFAFGYSYFMIRQLYSLEWVGIISLSYALTFLLMASYLYMKGVYQEGAFVMFTGQAALFLIITVPIIFSKHWITVFWAAQAVTLLWMGMRLNKDSLILGALALLLLSIGKFTLHDYVNVFGFRADSCSIAGSYTNMILERSITSIFLLLVIYGFLFMTKRAALSALTHVFNTSRDYPAYQVLFGVFLFVVLNIETASFFHDYLLAARFAAQSVLWTIFSVVLMTLGFRHNNSLLRKIALVLFSVTLLKVFSFDMSNISTPYRIISFIILGIMLVATSYLYYKFRDRLMDVVSDGAPNKDKQT